MGDRPQVPDLTFRCTADRREWMEEFCEEIGEVFSWTRSAHPHMSVQFCRLPFGVRVPFAGVRQLGGAPPRPSLTVWGESSVPQRAKAGGAEQLCTYNCGARLDFSKTLLLFLLFLSMFDDGLDWQCTYSTMQWDGKRMDRRGLAGLESQLRTADRQRKGRHLSLCVSPPRAINSLNQLQTIGDRRT